MSRRLDRLPRNSCNPAKALHARRIKPTAMQSHAHAKNQRLSGSDAAGTTFTAPLTEI